MLNCRTGWALRGAAVIVLLIPLEQLPAQTRPTGTPGVPTQSSPTGTPTTTSTTVTVNPKSVINAVGGLFKKKPKPVPTPVPTPAAVSIPVVQAIPTSAPRPRAQAKPAPVPQPTPQPRVTQIKSPPVRKAAAAPLPQPSQIPLPRPSAAAVPELIVPPAPILPVAPAQSPLWLWLAALLAAVGLGELMRRWFWPIPKLACDFETGSAKLTGWSKPALSPPEVQFNVAIDLGQASAPSGVSIQPLEKLS